MLGLLWAQYVSSELLWLFTSFFQNKELSLEASRVVVVVHRKYFYQQNNLLFNNNFSGLCNCLANCALLTV